MSTYPDKAILSVKGLLSLPNVVIPDYQRPYKWSLKNVAELFQDLASHQDKQAYRLGAVVFHRHSQNDCLQLDIVDGQQRTLTLVLAVWALRETRFKDLQRQDLKDSLETLQPLLLNFMARQSFASKLSQFNLHQNFLELKRLVSRSDFSESQIDFLLHKCQVVTFVLHDVSEAFQFFDSQNARGRDLEPHDLLKAFHLREFADHESDLKAVSVAHWESLPSDDLASLFANYLYRVRQWAKGKSARLFGKGQIELFKGVNLDNVGHFPYVESLRIAHHYVDDYNSQYQRKIDGQKQVFPFHLDQMIINGRRFFELAEHYQQQVARIIADKQRVTDKQSRLRIQGEELSELASRILDILNSYPKRTRTGDQYVRGMFDCALLFYIDKFGSHELSRAIEKIFIWAYRCRIQMQVVQLATVDNYVKDNNLFSRIKEATRPHEVLTLALPSLTVADNKNNRNEQEAADDPLVRLFRDMNYYE